MVLKVIGMMYFPEGTLEPRIISIAFEVAAGKDRKKTVENKLCFLYRSIFVIFERAGREPLSSTESKTSNDGKYLRYETMIGAACHSRMCIEASTRTKAEMSGCSQVQNQ
jgi:hypothetical protein